MNDPVPTAFAVDCYKRWRAGHVYLPLVADVYGEAAGLLGGGDARPESDAFSRMGSNQHADDIPVTGSVFPNYVALRDDVVAVLSHISDRLYRVGEVLVDTGINYADTDTENTNEIGSARDQFDWLVDNREDADAGSTLTDGEGEERNSDDLAEAPTDPSDPNLHGNDDILLPEDDEED